MSVSLSGASVSHLGGAKIHINKQPKTRIEQKHKGGRGHLSDTNLLLMRAAWESLLQPRVSIPTACDASTVYSLFIETTARSSRQLARGLFACVCGLKPGVPHRARRPHPPPPLACFSDAQLIPADSERAKM